MYHHFRDVLTSGGSFWEAFFAELFASLIVLTIASFLIPKYLDWRKKPKLTIINQRSRNDTFNLTRAADNSWEATLNLVIKNEGPTTQREWFWHLIVPLELQPQITMLDATVTCQANELKSGGQRWRHYFGSSTPKEVIYSGRNLKFNYELKVKTTDQQPKGYKIYYYFSTEFGTWPRKAMDLESVIDKPEVVFGSDYLGKINLEPEA